MVAAEPSDGDGRTPKFAKELDGAPNEGDGAAAADESNEGAAVAPNEGAAVTPNERGGAAAAPSPKPAVGALAAPPNENA